MKTSEIRELTNQELVERIDTEQVNLTRMKMNHAVSPLDNPIQIMFARRLVARLKTEFKVREISKTQKSE
ncbi:MAG: 50S ribosomal protein L29 [Bacteroidota bacterium]|nr:50S ribosomal protein L29 [Bacteroidota bacterium]